MGALKKESELNRLFQKEVYTPGDKARMLALMESLGIRKSDTGEFVLLRKIRGQLIKRKKDGTAEIVASGRSAWVGWAELRMAHVNEIAIQNTGRVIRDVQADVLAVIEAEHRVALAQFSDLVLEQVQGTPYAQVMLIDGNDERGIDVGLMTRSGYAIGQMRSHIYDLNDDRTPIFSRDCPEYCVETPSGLRIWVLPNHFKSKYGGNDVRSRERRAGQAKRTAEIYQRLIGDGQPNVVVLGDLNDTPQSAELTSLLVDTDLRDVSQHPSFDPGVFPGIGTFGLGNDKVKIDYLLLSPDLFTQVTAAGLFRMGAWPGKRPGRWPVYNELVEPVHAASDHHVIWCDIDV